MLPLLKRLRWFFFSLLLLGICFPPGEAGPAAGLLFGLERIGILTAIVLAAHLLMNTTSTPMLTAALVWLLAPFIKLGFPGERLAIRLTLVLDTVREAQEFREQASVNSTRHPGDKQPQNRSLVSRACMQLKNIKFFERLQEIGDRVARMFLQALQRGETAPLRILEIPLLTRPSVWQWSYPLVMCIILAIGQIY
ncbi:MAG: hypothetical protein GY862_19685 [Gammaproteobacteria bacterium]|nr:hypothetical protein [Gammaproteobacteria bacterium]